MTRFSGIVQKNAGRGRTLGFPTANIEAPVDIKDALYLGYTTLEGERFPSLIYVGTPETFDDPLRRVETYILDFASRDLYGRTIEVTILDKLRNNIRFESAEKLQKQMQKDVEAARKYFKL